MELVVLIHPRDARALEEAAESVGDPGEPGYGRFATCEELRRFVGLGYQDLDAAIAWLQDSGLSTDEPAGAWTVVRARGPVEAVERALDAPVGRYETGEGETLSIERTPALPASLASVVRGVAGLHGFPVSVRAASSPDAATARRKALRPGDKRLGLPAGDGAGERLVVLELAPPATGGAPTEDGLGAALVEEWLRALAPAATVDVVRHANDDRAYPDFLAMLLDWKGDGRPTIAVLPWGLPEPEPSGSPRVDQTRPLFRAASLLGVAFVAADLGETMRPPSASFPACLASVSAAGSLAAPLAFGGSTPRIGGGPSGGLAVAAAALARRRSARRAGAGA